MRHKNTYNDLCYVTFYNKFVNWCLYPWIKEQSVNSEMMTIHREDCFYLLDSVWWYLNSTKFQSLCQFSTQTYCIGYALGPHIVWLWSVGDKELSKFQYIQFDTTFQNNFISKQVWTMFQVWTHEKFIEWFNEIEIDNITCVMSSNTFMLQVIIRWWGSFW